MNQLTGVIEDKDRARWCFLEVYGLIEIVSSNGLCYRRIEDPNHLAWCAFGQSSVVDMKLVPVIVRV